MTPKISVVLPVYNVEAYIEECIDSILSQTIQDFEIIVIDDCSTDNTLKLIESYSDSRIIIKTKNSNKGLIDSLNLGFEIARGKYIARMDGDDISKINRFQKQLEILEGNPEIDVCGCWLQEFGNAKKVIKHKENHNQIVTNMLWNCSMSLGSVMLNRKSVVGFKFNENKKHVEDYDFWSRIAWSCKLYNIQDVLYYYRVHEKQVSKIHKQIQVEGDVKIKLFLFKKLGYNTNMFSDKIIAKVLLLNRPLILKDLDLFVKWLKELTILNKKKNVFLHNELQDILRRILRALLFSLYFRDTSIGITKQWRIKALFKLPISEILWILNLKQREMRKTLLKKVNKKKQIVFKVPEFPHVSETFIVAQIVTAIKLDYKVKILIRKLTDTNANVYSSLVEEYGLLEKIIVEDYKIPLNKLYRILKWGQIIILNFNHLSHIIKYYKEQSKFSLTWLFEWCFYKQFNNTEIFHVQYGTNHKPIAVLKKIKFFKPDTIVTFHGHDAFFPLYGYIPNNNYYKNLFENNILITANTPYLANKIENLGCPKEKIKIIPVGVDNSFFYPKKLEKSQIKQLKLITVGRLDEVKGHQYCIEVVSKLLKDDIDVSLTIIGEGIERNNLENLISKYNLKSNVFLKGAKSQEYIRQELWRHDIYMLLAVPLVDGRRETQGLATLEAQACGLPAIVFDSGGVKYTVEDKITGFICKEFDVEEVVKKIKSFAINPDVLSKMGKNAVEFVTNKFSQKVIDKKWDAIYRKIYEP